MSQPMSHFKVLPKAHTVPRLLTGHRGDVEEGGCGGGKDGRTADQSVEKENVFQFERSRGKLGIEEVSRRKAGGPLQQMFI